MMRKIAMLAATLAATACWIPAASAQNHSDGLSLNVSRSDVQNLAAGVGHAEFAVGSNDMSVSRSGTGPLAGNLGPGSMERMDLANPAAGTAGFATSNQAIKP